MRGGLGCVKNPSETLCSSLVEAFPWSRASQHPCLPDMLALLWIPPSHRASLLEADRSLDRWWWLSQRWYVPTPLLVLLMRRCGSLSGPVAAAVGRFLSPASASAAASLLSTLCTPGDRFQQDAALFLWSKLVQVQGPSSWAWDSLTSWLSPMFSAEPGGLLGAGVPPPLFFPQQTPCVWCVPRHVVESQQSRVSRRTRGQDPPHVPLPAGGLPAGNRGICGSRCSSSG